MQSTSVNKSPTDARQGDRKFVSYRVLTRSLLIAIVAGAVIYAGYYFTNTADSVPPTAPAAAPK